MSDNNDFQQPPTAANESHDVPARELTPSGPAKPCIRLTPEQLDRLAEAYVKLGQLIRDAEARARAEWVS